MSWFKGLRETSNWVLALLAAIVSAMSLIKALVFFLEVGIKPFYAKMIAYYRDLLQPVYDLIYLIPWPFDLPEYAIDLFVIYAIGLGLSVRLRIFALEKLGRCVGVGYRYLRNPRLLDIMVPFNFTLILRIRKLVPIVRNRTTEILNDLMTDINQIRIDLGDKKADEVMDDYDLIKSIADNNIVAARQAVLTVILLPILVIVFFGLNGI